MSSCLSCCRDASYRTGKALCSKLKELIPRQMFRVPIQVGVLGQFSTGLNVGMFVAGGGRGSMCSNLGSAVNAPTTHANWLK
jgi:hypothetical protein